MNFQNRQQLLAVVAIAAVSLLAADRLVLTPLLRSWSARSVRVADLRKSVNQGVLLLDRQAVIRERWESMRTNCLAPDASVAENQVLKAFDRWAQESRVSVHSVKPQAKRANDGSTTLECRVDASGSLSSLTRLLYSLEADPMALKLDAVELTARDDRGEQLTLGLLVNGLMWNPESSR